MTTTFRYTKKPQCHEQSGSEWGKTQIHWRNLEFNEEFLAIIMTSVESDDMMFFFEDLLANSVQLF